MARGALEICSAVSAEQTSPGASSQAGALLCGNARKITPRCVWVEGYFLVRRPGEQLCIGRGFGQISSLLLSFKFLSCKTKG